jgi:hypothetical protein
MRKLYIPLVGSAPRASKVAPKQPHPPTTIASPSTTLAPTPRCQRLTTVGGWCDTITQPFLIHTFLFSGVSSADTIAMHVIVYILHLHLARTAPLLLWFCMAHSLCCATSFWCYYIHHGCGAGAAELGPRGKLRYIFTTKFTAYCS